MIAHRFYLLFFRRLHPCAVVLLLMLIACKPSIPVGIASEGELEDILYDYNLAIAMADNATLADGQDREMLRYQYVQKVFDKHGITEEEFDSTMVWYSADGKRLQTICKRLNERFDAEAKTMGVDMSETEVYANYTADGDTANIWNGQHILYLSNYQPDNLRIISLPADSTFLPDDSYKLAFNSHFLPLTGSRSVYAMFSVYYVDSTVVSQVQMIGGDYKSELNLSPREHCDSIMPDRLVITLYSPPVSQDQTYQVFYMTYPSVLRIHKPKSEKQKAEEETSLLDADSLEVDSMDVEKVVSDTISRRLTPLEERDMRTQRHDIKIVKERIPKAPARPQQRAVRRRTSR